jgi:DnaD/phage-associated family protein
MDFFVKPESLSAAFLLPADITDKHIKLAGALQLKVILYCYRHMADGFDAKKISEALSISEDDVKDALNFWCELGVLGSNEQKTTVLPTVVTPTPPPKAIKPNRGEVARRGLEDAEIAFLLSEAQIKFGRTLKQSESSLLVWLYDDLGLNAAVILMAIEYALQAGKCNVGYIEKVGKDWAESGVDTVLAAENKIAELGNERLYWNVMRSAFGLDTRAPSESETKLANLVIGQWKMEKSLLKKAYDLCVDQIGKYRASYIKTILTSWHKKGICSVADLEKETKAAEKPKAKSKGSYATYDISKLDEIINGD